MMTEEDELWLREYHCDAWRNEGAETWTLRHTFPDHHTIRDIVAPTLHEAIEKSKGGE